MDGLVIVEQQMLQSIVPSNRLGEGLSVLTDRSVTEVSLEPDRDVEGETLPPVCLGVERSSPPSDESAAESAIRCMRPVCMHRRRLSMIGEGGEANVLAP